MSRRRQSIEEASVNLTPMIDVVFLLVFFFMVSSKFGAEEGRIEVNVPGVGELRSLSRVPDERLVEITGDGITLDNSVVSEQQLAAQLRYARDQYPDIKVAVRGDGQASFQRVAEVLQVIRSTGVREMGIAVRSTRR